MTTETKKQSQITLQIGVFQERQVVMMNFDMIRTFRGASWDTDFRCWCIPQEVFDLDRFILIIEPLADIDQSIFKSGKSLPDRGRAMTVQAKKKRSLPKYWLFEGINRKQYSASNIIKIVSRAAVWAGIEQRVTPHMLRALSPPTFWNRELISGTSRPCLATN